MTTKGKKKRRVLCWRFSRFSRDYLNGSKKFRFNDSIYGDSTVRNELIKAQFSKCCYCETEILEEGEIEHFRPKSECRQDSQTTIEKSGYYWLVYEWTNLVYACSTCNRKKSIYFPLRDPQTRAKSHKDNLDQEQPLLINPAETDPAKHITFTIEGKAEAINGSLLGQTTIEILQLNRGLLRHRREKQAALLKLIFTELSRLDLAISAEVQTFLNQSVEDQSEYAAYARVVFAQLTNQE
ncbi:MAG TPA: TIGR02646 family protein [Acidobacteriota bacterium]|nr:TIGR02646 family protein [Acidobacteriota bacterium]